jgi:hypothetical protein
MSQVGQGGAGTKVRACAILLGMKFGMRKPSLRKSIAARTSVKRAVRQSLGLRAPRGYGWLTNPRRAAYNRVYNRTSFSFWSLLRRLFR